MLSFQILNPNGISLNNLQVLPNLTIIKENANAVYIQLINQQAPSAQGMSCPTRFIPASGATLTATFYRSQSCDLVVKSASNPFPDDRSIWLINLTPDESKKVSSGYLLVTLTDGFNVTNIRLDSVVKAVSVSGCC